jgi:hypothetical protein
LAATAGRLWLPIPWLQELELRPAGKKSKAAAGRSKQQDEEATFNLDQMFGDAAAVAKAAGIPAAQACTLAQLFLVLRKVTNFKLNLLVQA